MVSLFQTILAYLTFFAVVALLRVTISALKEPFEVDLEDKAEGLFTAAGACTSIASASKAKLSTCDVVGAAKVEVHEWLI